MKYAMLGNPEKRALETPHLIIAPTYDCNLSCKHCYNGEIENILSKEQWKCVIGKWADFVRREGKDGIVHFKGGEPFGYKGLDDLLDYSAERGLWAFITSNGTLIGDEEDQHLGRLYGRTKGKVILSLNGSTPETDEMLRQEGVYQKTVEASKRLRANNVPFDINYVTHSGNEEDIERAIYLAKELGAVQFNLLPLVERGYARKNGIGIPDLAKVLTQVDKARNNGVADLLEWSVADMIQKLGSGEYVCNSCTAGFRGLAYITPDGNVYSCPNTVFDEFRLGTIEQSPEQWFESENAKELREMNEVELVCKGEFIEYRYHMISPTAEQKLKESEELIKKKIAETKRTSEKRKPVALCFNRNW